MNNKGLSGAALKNIAIITMLIDHLTHVLYRVFLLELFGKDNALYIYYPLRMIGRISFVLFAFLVGQAIVYTRSRKRYILSLLIFSLISELPFDLALRGKTIDLSHQNVFITLLLGAIACIFIEKYKDRKWLAIIIAVICMATAEGIHSDYGGAGVLLIVLLYVYRSNYYGMLCIAFPAFVACLMITNGIWRVLDSSSDNMLMTFVNACSNSSLEIFGIVGIYIINYYNGSKGKGLNKWFYYCFYPGHLMLLYGLVGLIRYIKLR